MEELTAGRAPRRANAARLAELMLLLWPGHHRGRADGRERRAAARRRPGALSGLWWRGSGGLAHCALRHDYVEGCGDGPVAAMEALRPSRACRGVARA